MSANIYKFDRESICATCLSQDRKLFAVSDVQACAKFYCELSLTWTDRLCWECHYMARKIIIFKNKAQKAQAWLRTATKSQPSEIPCLSSLDTSTGIFLDVTSPGLTSSNTSPQVNATPPQVNATPPQANATPPHVNATPPQVNATPPQGNATPPQVNATPPQANATPPQVNATLPQAIPPPVFVTVKQENLDESMSEDGSRAGRSWQDVYEDRLRGKVKIEIEVELPAIETPKPKRRKAPVTKMPTVENIYTEKTLSEEGMLEWWRKKKEMKYYTQSIPHERCDKCLQPLDCQTLVNVHAERHTEHYGDFECDVCTQRLNDERELEAHRKLHYRILKCNYCDFVWDDVNSMRQHCSELHSVKQTMWDCEQCNKHYPSSKKFTAHVRSTHRRTKCPDCGKSYTPGCLKLHMVQHRGGKPLRSCAECGGQFRGDEGLKTHMRTHNIEVDPEAFCKDCNIQFRDMLLYLRHMRKTKIHATESDYKHKCKECGVKYIMLAHLREHMNVHTDTVHPCGQCDRSFNSQRRLQAHVKRKHEARPPVKDKLCDYCGRGFASKGVLASHINTHTGARPFVCKLCGADFGHKSALYLHGRYKHKIQKKKEKGTVNTKKNSEKDASEKTSVDIVKDKEDKSSSSII